jgi:Fic family protein
MHTFRVLDQQIGLVPAVTARTLGAVDTARGRADVFRMQRPQILEALVDVARIQSTEASNAIERVVAPRRRIEALVAQKTTPRNRSEAEIAGYRAVLDLIHESALQIPFRPSVVEQLHRDLYQYTTVPAGRWKRIDNAIEEELPDGTRRVRFRTVPAAETPAAMAELHRRFLDARDAGEHHPLLLIGAYVFDFLAIHPFRDGNGRMARLLTLLLLYQSGYEVGRYVSLERLVNDAKEGYYDSLQAAGVGWHEDQHTIWPWLEYMLGILVAAYREFEDRVGLLGDSRGAKTAAIERFVRERISDEFTIADVRDASLGASDSLIGKVLARLRDEGVIEPLGTGRSAKWRRFPEIPAPATLAEDLEQLPAELSDPSDSAP